MAERQAEDARRAVGDDVACVDRSRAPQRLGVSLIWIG